MGALLGGHVRGKKRFFGHGLFLKKKKSVQLFELAQLVATELVARPFSTHQSHQPQAPVSKAFACY
jgi:hypothetical protein